MISKRKTVGRGLVLSGSLITLALLAILSNFSFSVPSIPESETDQSVEETAEVAETDAESLIADTEQQDETAGVVESEETKAMPVQAESPERIDVIIDGDEYLVRLATDQTQRTSMLLSDIVKESVDAASNRDDFQILIRRTFKATAEAESRLLTALGDAGLGEDQIDSRQKLLPSVNDE